MKSNPAVPGGSLTSKPTWSNTSGCSTTSVFFRRPAKWRPAFWWQDAEAGDSKALKSRYGPKYTTAMVSAAFLAFFLPIPGTCLVGVGLVVVVAELHRTISKERQRPC